MAKLVWDKSGERLFETGVSKGVLYPQVSGAYPEGVVWNGLTSVTESPSGADISDLWADNIKYASIRAAESFGATIEAYTYPDEFAACDGSAELVPGAFLGQQKRTPFGLSYRTQIGSDSDTSAEEAYKLHIIYNATAAPSDRSYSTMNESADAITFSWELSTTPVPVTGHRPTASLIIDSSKVDADKLKALEAILYGSDAVEADPEADPPVTAVPAVVARLPLPDEIKTLLATD